MANSLLLASLLFFLSLHLSPSSSISTSPSSCPVDLSYVSLISWNYSSCQGSTNQTNCCQTLLSLFGIAIAENLKSTSLFQFPNDTVSSSCLDDFQQRLTALSLPPIVVSSCFPSPSRFTISPNLCAGIRTKDDWLNKMGPSSSLDRSCSGDLSDLSSCHSCVDAGVKVQSQLAGMDGNSSHGDYCWYFAILYAAGIANVAGPADSDTASCIFGLQIATPTPVRRHRRAPILIFAPIVAFLLSVITALGVVIIRLELTGKRKPTITRPFIRPNTGAIWFKIAELEKATDGFTQRNLIGSGGFGVVYKGVLPDGVPVAVKKMIDMELEDDSDFCREIEIISNIKHRNLLPLRGCCVVNDGPMGPEKYLVWDYMENGSLDDFIFSCGERKKPTFSWPQRKNVVLDIAKGLSYLHYGVKPAIFHRDIKATNILLDGDMNARVADFGLAKQVKEGQSHLTTRVAGTHGYLAPEYALYGQLSEKSDVYSFGVLVLEIMSGRKALDVTQSPGALLVTDWAWRLVKSGKIEEVIEKEMRENGGPKALMERFVLVGILCAHVMVAFRPTIAEALKMLEGDVEISEIPDRPLPLSHGFAESSDAFSLSLSPSSGGINLNLDNMLR